MTVDPRIVALYDEYTHAPLDRRAFLDRLAGLAGGAAAAAAILPLLEPGYARAQTVPEGDPDVAAERVSVPGEAGPVPAYLARPAAGGRTGAVIVVHENRGLNPHIEDVTRRVAKAGLVGLAPDFLGRLGGTPADPDAARDMIGRLPAEAVDADMAAALRFLAAHPAANGRVGAVGFCWGGGVVGRFAVRSPELAAGVVFYGSAPPADAVPAIRAPLLLHYAERDARINAGVPAFEAALRSAGKRFELHMYPGTDHAFHNDAGGARHDPAAARVAWERTVAFLRRELAAG